MSQPYERPSTHSPRRQAREGGRADGGECRRGLHSLHAQTLVYTDYFELESTPDLFDPGRSYEFLFKVVGDYRASAQR